MANIETLRSVAKTALGKQIQHHAVASPRGRKYAPDFESEHPFRTEWTETAWSAAFRNAIVSLCNHACVTKSAPQIACLLSSQPVARIFVSQKGVANPFAGCDKMNRPDHASPAGGRWFPAAFPISPETVYSGDRDGVEFDKCAHWTSEPQLKFSDQTLPSFVSRQGNGYSRPLTALIKWDFAHDFV